MTIPIACRAMFSPSLRDVRINVVLVPAVLVAVGALAVLACALWLGATRRDAAREHLRHMAGVAAAMSHDVTTLDLSALLKAGPGLRCLALFQPQTDLGAALLRHVGVQPGIPDDAPPPELVSAWTSARAWTLDDGHAAVAAPIRDADQRPLALLYAETSHPLPSLADPLVLGLGIGVQVLLGLGLGLYLARRIWLPVVGLERQAEAALHGGVGGPVVASAETSRLASAVDELARRYASTSSGEFPPPSAGGSAS